MIPYPTVESMVKKHGNTATGRMAARAEIRAYMVATAEREAQSAGRSIRCKHGDHRSVYIDGRGKKWPAGCQNDGSGCICECHDPSPAVSEEER